MADSRAASTPKGSMKILFFREWLIEDKVFQFKGISKNLAFDHLILNPSTNELSVTSPPSPKTERGDDSPSPQGEGLGLPAGHSRQAKWKWTTGFYRAVGSANIVTPDFSRVNKAHQVQSAVRHDT